MSSDPKRLGFPSDVSEAEGSHRETSARFAEDLKRAVTEAKWRAAKGGGQLPDQPDAERRGGRSSGERPCPGAPAIPAGAFQLHGSWTVYELLRASAEVWRDLAEVEDDESTAEGFLAMATDLEQYARALETRALRGTLS